MRSTKLSLGACLAVVALVASAGQATASPPPAARGETVDVALVAKARGWTIEQARADRDVTDRLGRVQERVASLAPDAFVGGVLASTPGGTPTLLVKGKASDAIREAVAEAGITIRIADGQPYSLKELTDRSTLLRKELTGLGYRDFSTAVDVTKGRVVGAVTARTGLPSSFSTLSAALPAQLRTGVELTVVDKPVGALSSAFGGMHVSDTGGGFCTSGWSVRHNTTGLQASTPSSTPPRAPSTPSR